jgi:HD superfamily phosphohydrolase
MINVKKSPKIFQCNIHGNIKVSAMAMHFIDTPEFQRLREMKQLGLAHLVYPSATHTRFEHSLGTYHIADLILMKIRGSYPGMRYYINELEDYCFLDGTISECIKIGALCHDIGHGPYSHFFDDFLSKYTSLGSHEERSCAIVEMICKRELPDMDPRYIRFIQAVILPKERKGIIYQIVCNEYNGIDVDKFDYLKRDSYNLGLNISFDFHRLINEIKLDEEKNIIYPKNCCINIYELFHSRYLMFKKVYSHKTIKGIELMMKDFYYHLDSILKMSEYLCDINHFCQFVDASFLNHLYFMQYTILSEEEKEHYEAAKMIHRRLVTRDLYKLIIETIKNQAHDHLRTFVLNMAKKYQDISVFDFEITTAVNGLIRKNDKFLDNISFYKNDTNETFTFPRHYYSGLLNNNNEEIYTYLFYKKNLYLEEIRKEAIAFMQEIK